MSEGVPESTGAGQPLRADSLSQRRWANTRPVITSDKQDRVNLRGPFAREGQALAVRMDGRRQFQSRAWAAPPVHHRRTGGFEEGLAFFRSQVGGRSSSTHTAYSYQPYIWEFCACFHFAFPLLVFCIISHPHLFVTKSTEGVFRARVVRCEHQSTRPGCAHRGVGFRARCVSLGPHTAGRTKAAATAPEDVDWASDSSAG